MQAPIVGMYCLGLLVLQIHCCDVLRLLVALLAS